MFKPDVTNALLQALLSFNVVAEKTPGLAQTGRLSLEDIREMESLLASQESETPSEANKCR